MKIYQIVQADHVESDVGDIAAAIVLGDNIERALLDRGSPFSMMMEKAREEFIAAILSLADPNQCDLNTEAGIRLARSQQANAQRYRDMCRFIAEALSDAGEADETAERAEEEGDDAVQQLKEQMNGKRAQPAPDA